MVPMEVTEVTMALPTLMATEITGAARRGRPNLLRKLTPQLTPGTHMGAGEAMGSHTVPTDPTQVTMALPTLMAMVTMAARRGRLSLLRKLTPQLTPGTHMGAGEAMGSHTVP